MKKLLAIILTLAMVLSVLTIETIFAATEPTITVETVEAKAGDTVEVKVLISNNPGIWGLKVKIAYDRSALTLTAVENGDFFADSEWTKGKLDKETYTLSYGANDFADITTVSGTLATLTFSVSDTAEAGDYDMTVSYVAGDIINANLDDVDFTMVNGKVTIPAPTPEVTPEPTPTPNPSLKYLTYEISNNEVTITDCDESVSGALEIPSTIDGYPVTCIYGSAFNDCINLTSITIPDYVTNITVPGLKNCTNLETVNFNAISCTSMGYTNYYVFSKCENLKTVNIGDKVTIIPQYAFLGCSGLTTITIPENVIEIGKKAFGTCTNLETVFFNAIECTTQSSSNSSIFTNCTKIKTVNIGDKVTTIPQYAFYMQQDISTVYYSGTEEQWNDIDFTYGNGNLREANVIFKESTIPTATPAVTPTITPTPEVTVEPTATPIPTPALEGAITGATVDIGSSLTINYFADAPENATMKFTSSSGRITEVNGVFDSETGYYKFAYTGINPQCMSDTIKAELMVGEEVLDVKENYSVKAYCDNMANGHSNLNLSPSQYEALKTLLADMLTYGSASQEYKDYNTSNLADSSEWVSEYKSTFYVPTAVKKVTGNTDANNKVKSVGLNMANVNKVYFKMILTDDVTVKLNGAVVDKASFVENKDGSVTLYTDSIFATQFNNVYTLDLIKDGTVISTVQYNVNAYIQAKYNTSGLENIVKALSNYGTSAVNYQRILAEGDFNLDEDEL